MVAQLNRLAAAAEQGAALRSHGRSDGDHAMVVPLNMVAMVVMWQGSNRGQQAAGQLRIGDSAQTPEHKQ
jgi:hypothetical protein